MNKELVSYIRKNAESPIFRDSIIKHRKILLLGKKYFYISDQSIQYTCTIKEETNLKNYMISFGRDKLILPENEKIIKVFHYARFDIAVFKHNFKINIKNIYCTKIASKLVRTYTDKHGYKDLCSELLGKSISKTEQSSDWGGELTKAQQRYAATDVLYLHKIKDKLDSMLLREKRSKLAKACFDFIQYRTDLDINGWSEQDIFKH